MINFAIDIDGMPAFDRTFNRLANIDDFRPVWPGVAEEFYAIEEEQFDSEGAAGASGKWSPLSPIYKRWKELHYPGEPILKLEHPLYQSLTRPDAADSVFRMTPNELVVGSRTPYARAHQYGTSIMPARPPISLKETHKRRLQKAIQEGLVRFLRAAGIDVEERAA